MSKSLQFLRPMRIGDEVTAGVNLIALVPARCRVRLHCECMVDGRAVLEGEAWETLRRRDAA